jgi:hypothetical protein
MSRPQTLHFRSRQLATPVLLLMGTAGAAIIAVLILVEFDPIALGVLVILLACALHFWALTVEVTSTVIHLSFGVGFVRKNFPVSKVRRAAVVRNRWYYGLGIRRLRDGWLYNVSGLDAVEIEMQDGQTNRIGTDRPQELAAAILAARDAALGGKK